MQKTKQKCELGRQRKERKKKKKKITYKNRERLSVFPLRVLEMSHCAYTLSCPDETTGGLRDKSLVAYGSLKRKYNGT